MDDFTPGCEACRIARTYKLDTHARATLHDLKAFGVPASMLERIARAYMTASDR